MKYRVTHATSYEYGETISLCHNEGRFFPRSLPLQRCQGSSVRISPQPGAYRERIDYFGNRVCYFAVQTQHQRMEVEVVSEVETLPATRVDLDTDMPWEDVRRRVSKGRDPEALEARQFLLDSPMIQPAGGVLDYARPSFPKGAPLMACARDLTRRIHEDFEFDAGFSTIATPLAEVLENRRGVCQDFAQLAIACLRSLGLPARYVSGYIETFPPPGQPKLVGSDASHAWLAAYSPRLGWIDFDPTNDQLAGERHVVSAWGRDYSDVAPLKGVVFSAGDHKLEVSVDVAPLD